MSIRTTFIFSIILFCTSAFSQAQTIFSIQKAAKITEGDTVIIQKNAVIIDSIEFEKIRINLLHYTELKNEYETHLSTNKNLLKQLIATQNKLKLVLDKSNLQSEDLIAINHIVLNLKSLSEEMEVVNNSLESNNEAFNATIQELEITNKKLRKEIRKLRFRNIRDYIVAGLVGALVGGTIVAIN